LIKALRKFKLSRIPYLSSFCHHESPLNKEANVVHLKGNQSSYGQRKVKLKCRKLYFKVVRDLLMKKWIIVIKD
jgi:hypothetical protein